MKVRQKGKNFSHLRKTKATWVCSKGLRRYLCPCPSWPGKKLVYTDLVWEILNIFMHYQPDKKLNYLHVSGNRPDCYAGIVNSHDLDLTKKFGSSFLVRTIRGRLPNCRSFVITIGIIQLFTVLSLTYANCKIFVLALPTWIKSCANFLKSNLHHGAVFVTDIDSIDSSLLHSRQNLKQKKTTCSKLRIKICNNLLIAPGT